MFHPGAKEGKTPKLVKQVSNESDQAVDSSQVKPPPPYPGLIAGGPMLCDYDPPTTPREQYVQTPPPPPPYTIEASPYSGRSSSGARTPGTPGSTTSSMASSSADVNMVLFDDDGNFLSQDPEKKPVLTQWVENSGVQLFHELSTSMNNLS